LRDLYLARDLGLRLGDERTQVPAPHVRLDIDAALAVIAADLVEPFGQAETGQLPQWHRGARAAGPGRQQDGQGAKVIDVVALGQRRAHHDVKAAVTGEQQTRRAPSQGGSHRVSHFGQRQAVAGNRLAIELDIEGREPMRLRNTQIGHAAHAPQRRRNPLCRGAHLVQVIAIHLHGHVAAYASGWAASRHRRCQRQRLSAVRCAR